jgi:tetratricopeptide (TPR) repeat protein
MLGQKTMSIDEPLGILKSATASADAPAKMAIESILAFSFLYRGKPAEALPFARDLLKSSPESETAFQVLYTALSETGNCAEVKVIADAWDATSGDDRLGKRALAVCAQRQSDYASVSRLYQAIIDGGRADSSDYNNKAWVALFFNPIPPSAIEDAQQAVAIEGHDNPVELHTLAALYADLGRTSEARETILKSIEASNDDTPAPSDWYVLGRIAEQYGVTDAAVAAYGRVTKPERESDMSSSTYLLAQRRLEILRGSTARPATR